MLDASAAVALIASPGEPSIEAMFLDRGATAFVPALTDVEVVSALRRFVLRGQMTPSRARQALSHYLELPLSRRDHQGLLATALELRDNFSAYDAMYVALAQELGATLVTADRRLATAVRRHLGLDVVLA